MARVVSNLGTKVALGLALAAMPIAAFATAQAAGGDASAPLSEEQIAKGRQLFTDNGCNACHALADANAAGAVGPSFDGNPNLDKGRAASVIMNGQGPMPSFSWMGEEEIDLVSAYIVQVKK